MLKKSHVVVSIDMKCETSCGIQFIKFPFNISCSSCGDRIGQICERLQFFNEILFKFGIERILFGKERTSLQSRNEI